MMELECGVYKPSSSSFPINNRPASTNSSNKREMSVCVAEDLSISAKKKPKTAKKECQKTSSNNAELEDNPLLDTEVVTQIMNIQDPLISLKHLLQRQLGFDLASFQIWLQDKFKLNQNHSLGEQCIQSEGLAQVKVEMKQILGQNRINIIDVLKLPEGEGEGDEDNDHDEIVEEEEDESSVEDLSVKSFDQSLSSNEKSSIRWTICKETELSSLFPIPLPNNPKLWSEIQFCHWLRWAIDEFKIEGVEDSIWCTTGEQLTEWTLEDFRKFVPVDPQNMLWTHLELLRKCRVFAIVDKGQHSQNNNVSLTQSKPSQPPTRKRPKVFNPGNVNGITKQRPSMTGNNGQIQLWQFLIELLGDRTKKNVIHWCGQPGSGEFKLNDPELVAQMWGERKNKPKMNYEKLSRALRYYYSEAMIAKVHGRRFVYRFVCNLKELVGYTPEELISIVNDDDYPQE